MSLCCFVRETEFASVSTSGMVSLTANEIAFSRIQILAIASTTSGKSLTFRHSLMYGSFPVRHHLSCSEPCSLLFRDQ